MAVELELTRSADAARRLDGKVAVVTGAGSDGDLASVGMATAVLFASQGAKVGVLDIDADRAERTAALIERVGGTGLVSVGDITQPEDCARCVGAVVDELGPVDVLVNSASIVGGGGDLAAMDLATWNRVLAINLTGTMLMSRAVVPAMRQQGGGSIINVSSIAGLRGMGSGPYAAAKGGVVAFTYDAAYAHGRDHIRVNCIAPGHLFTPMGNQGGEELRQRRRKAGLLGTEGTAWDAAWCALFLASDESRWITGVVVPVDAGAIASTALAVGNLPDPGD